MTDQTFPEAFSRAALTALADAGFVILPREAK